MPFEPGSPRRKRRWLWTPGSFCLWLSFSGSLPRQLQTRVEHLLNQARLSSPSWRTLCASPRVSSAEESARTMAIPHPRPSGVDNLVHDRIPIPTGAANH